MGQLPVDFCGEGSFLHRQDNRSLPLRQRRCLHIDDVVPDPRAGQGQVVLNHWPGGSPRLMDEREQRTVGWNQVIQALTLEVAGTALKQLLAGVVDVDDAFFGVDGEDDGGDHVEDQVGVDFLPARRLTQIEHTHVLCMTVRKRRPALAQSTAIRSSGDPLLATTLALPKQCRSTPRWRMSTAAICASSSG